MPKGIYQHKTTQGFQKGYIPWNTDKKLSEDNCICKRCHKKFHVCMARLQLNRGKFCSKKCMIDSPSPLIGKKRPPFSKEWKIK